VFILLVGKVMLANNELLGYPADREQCAGVGRDIFLSNVNDNI
jgi:hypothetical protein